MTLAVEKVKFINHKGHKAFSQRSQRVEYRFYLCVLCDFFVCCVVKKDFFNITELYIPVCVISFVELKKSYGFKFQN